MCAGTSLQQSLAWRYASIQLGFASHGRCVLKCNTLEASLRWHARSQLPSLWMPFVSRKASPLWVSAVAVQRSIIGRERVSKYNDSSERTSSRLLATAVEGQGVMGGGMTRPAEHVLETERVLPSVTEAMVGRVNEPLVAGLYLVGTPIGNLEDISFRAIRVLTQASAILAEDTRHSGRLLRHYGIRTPMLSYHRFNEGARCALLVERMQRGEVLAMISDAGMPAVSDPGAYLVAACADSAIPVVPIPGPCAVVAALAASGFLCTEFTFLGFLADKPTARRRRLEEACSARASQVLYVAPHKLLATLEDCSAAFGASRRCVVARELTKLHEEVWRGSLGGAVAEFTERSPRGEVTLVVEGADKDAADDPWAEDMLEDMLGRLLNEGCSPSEASRVVVLETSARRKQVYALALKVAAKRGSAQQSQH